MVEESVEQRFDCRVPKTVLMLSQVRTFLEFASAFARVDGFKETYLSSMYLFLSEAFSNFG